MILIFFMKKNQLFAKNFFKINIIYLHIYKKIFFK
jgi:hypothetical protein